MQVVIPREVLKTLKRMPVGIKARLLKAAESLQSWPNVSGVKALSGRDNEYRLRAGDYRIVFTVVSPNVIVIKIEHRSSVYKD